MHHQKQRPDQQALIDAAEQQRLQHGWDGGDGGADIRHIVQQERQHPPHQRELHPHRQQPQPDNQPGPQADQRFQSQIVGNAFQRPVQPGDMQARVIEGKTQFVGQVANLKKHKDHRHHQQHNAGHRPGKLGHQRCGPGHQPF